MKRTILICSLLAGIFLAAADAGFAQGVADLRLFEQRCYVLPRESIQHGRKRLTGCNCGR